MHYKFPKTFIWGTATAAYQIEGSAFEEGKGPSIWDTFSHIPGKIDSGDHGDVGCDHYHRFKEDLKIMKTIGIKSYRFSIAWARVLPQGKGDINQKGVDFYNRLIDGLIENGIEPIITLYHWDLPQALQDAYGGWANLQVVDDFVEYASLMFKLFGDRVKKWITHNEPWVVAYAGHYVGRHAPGKKDIRTAIQVTHHLILSHAKTVEAYRHMGQDGQIGITLNLYPIKAASCSQEDQQAALFVDGYHNRWFLDPVLKGEYPKDIWDYFKETFGAPIVSDEDLEILSKNRCDFLGVNYYFRKIIKQGGGKDPLNFIEVKPSDSEYTAMNWEIYAEGLYDLLLDLSKNYDYPLIYITENGAAFQDVLSEELSVNDSYRIKFLKEHFKEAYKAIQQGVRLEAYYVWSLMDNFEWAFGYGKRFGLIYIDYDSKDRIWKDSAYWYQKVIETNSIDTEAD
ncbi:GH1 family beta-glucosidase [Cellulosilyticum sp. I15G10I2]|uniref:GH1 family beta-glucosidase n=1 Tax=Cellulosilyticum sp. I15G10I2 TaxID=1892843 RepID=UPI00085C9D0D|nr:GH1 family beta-glucosidase [Cellulosilyticum sp. I15G10I2]